MRQVLQRLVSLVSLVLPAAVPASVSAQFTVTAGAADVEIGGRVHVQYSKSSVDGESGGPDPVDDVLLRRARIQLDLSVGDALDARIEPDFAGGGAALADAWVRLTLGSGLQLSAGQFKRAFSAFELTSSSDMGLIERDGRIEGASGCPGVGGVCSFSRFAQRLHFDDRDLGLRAEGSVGGGLSYLVTLTNGEGRNKADVNDARSASGRLMFAASDLRVGGFVGNHDYLDEAGETQRAVAFGADLELGRLRDGVHLLAGVQRGDNWLAGPDAKLVAVQALGSVYLPLAESGRFAALEPLLRVSWASTEDGAGPARGALLVTPGLALYVTGKNFVAVNLDWYDPDFVARDWSLKAQLFAYF